MSNVEIKERIHKAVDLAPESTLEEILNFVETKQGYFDEKNLMKPSNESWLRTEKFCKDLPNDKHSCCRTVS